MFPKQAGSWNPWASHSGGSWTHPMMQTQPRRVSKIKVFYSDAVEGTGGNAKRVFDLLCVMDSFNRPELCVEESGRV